MRVLYVTNSAEIGGGNQSLLTVWPALRRHGVEPVGVCPDDGPMVAAARRVGVACEVVDYHQPAWRDPLRAWGAHAEWIRTLARLEVDLIHANGPLAARCVAFSARHAGIPIVCHVHFPASGEAIRWAFRLMPKPRAFMFCSHATRAEMAPLIAATCPDASQVVVHNPVDEASFQPATSTDPRPFRVGIVANLLPVKGHLDFVEMAARLRVRGMAAEYWIIGEDIHRAGYRATLESTVRERGLADRVTFLGHRRDIPALLNQLDVVVCASHEEPFGICLLEAMSCERPVVATRVGGIPEVVEHGSTGLLVPPGRPDALADAVYHLGQDPALRQRLGRAGRARVLERFTPAACARAILDVYQSAGAAARMSA